MKLYSDDTAFEWKSFNPKQKEFILSTSPFTLGSGGFGSGKSTALVVRCILMGIDSPYFGDLSGNHLIIGRLKEKDFLKTTCVELKAWLPKKWIYKEYKKDGILLLKNGTIIHYTHFDTFEHLQSYNLGHAFLDQAEQISEQVFRELAYNRVRLKCLDRTNALGKIVRDETELNLQGVSMVCNPKRTWLYPKFVVNEEYGLSGDPLVRQKYNPDYKLINIPTLENTEHLPDNYIARQKRDKSDKEFARDVLGDWSKFEGQVYEDFTDDLVNKQNIIPNPTWSLYVGLDHGGTGTPNSTNATGITAVLFLAVEEKENEYPKIHVFDELYLKASTIEQTVAEIDAKLKGIMLQQRYNFDWYKSLADRPDVVQWRCDPSMCRTMNDNNSVQKISEVYMAHAMQRGMSMPLSGGDNNIDTGIHRANWLFRKKLIDVNPKVINLITELRSVEYGSNEKPKPMQADHAVKTLQYIASAIPIWWRQYELEEERQTRESKHIEKYINEQNYGTDDVFGGRYANTR
jgi:hypothetical protein